MANCAHKVATTHTRSGYHGSTYHCICLRTNLGLMLIEISSLYPYYIIMFTSNEWRINNCWTWALVSARNGPFFLGWGATCPNPANTGGSYGSNTWVASTVNWNSLLDLTKFSKSCSRFWRDFFSYSSRSYSNVFFSTLMLQRIFLHSYFFSSFISRPQIPWCCQPFLAICVINHSLLRVGQDYIELIPVILQRAYQINCILYLHMPFE